MRHSERFAIRALFPIVYSDVWVGHTCRSLLEGMRDGGVDISLHTPAKMPSVREGYVRPTLPLRLSGYAERYFPEHYQLSAYQLARSIEPGDVAYPWLKSWPGMTTMVHRRGGMVVREMVNCTMERRRNELVRAYDLLGWKDDRYISDQNIAKERDALLAADAVFCPNPFVRESVMAYGVSAERCIDASYGWSPERLDSRTSKPALEPIDGITVLFVGTVDVRKGAPWILDAWAKAGVKGRLVLAGVIDEDVKAGRKAILERDDVVCLGYVEDIAGIYRSADVFVFPSWEEGGPLVTLEAMAYGLPCVVTPMGTSGIMTDEHGVIVPPGDSDAIAEAFQRLAQDTELRRAMGEAGRQHVQSYTWKKAALRRLEGLRDRREKWKNGTLR